MLSADDIFSILVCPRCRGDLSDSTNGLVCLSCGSNFKYVDERPVLIDFAASILCESDYEEVTAATSPRISSSSRVHPDVRRNLGRFRDQLVCGSTVLVVGGGQNSHGLDLYEAQDVKVIGFDIYASPLTQFIADGHRIPLRDGSVDAVLIQAVLEHVLDPWQVVSEIYRVLRPSGVVYAETPFLQQVHEGAYDFTRFTDSGHRWLFRNFDVVDSGAIGGPGLQAVWTADFLARGLCGRKRAGSIARRAVGWLRRLDSHVPDPYRIDSAACVYFLGRRSPSPISPKAMREYYQGAQA